MGQIKAVCISEKKGTVKKDIGECRIIEDFGLENDAHAGSGRQVSLLSAESVEAFRQKTGGRVDLPPGVFGENLLVSGIRFTELPLGTRFECGDVILELMQIGKICHSGCEISKIAGECIMPREGVFAKVIHGGIVKTGDEITVVHQPGDASTGSDGNHHSGGKSETAASYHVPQNTSHRFTAAVITVSDRSFRGEREDKSGPVLCGELVGAGYEICEALLLPDEEKQLADELIRISDTIAPDVIFTTGGTGFAMRDRTPEATLSVADRNVPGIAEAIRAESMKITPRAMLSRAASVIRGQTLIINLPGSPKAVRETLGFVLPALEHGILILRGEADG
ncbi:MAG: MOSC domain-containing protein [Lachnospiraceae bacterium]|nr:MOSC domain-containing protein [Lachnospiraceae bacterium]